MLEGSAQISVQYGVMASRTSGRSGLVALGSRYTDILALFDETGEVKAGRLARAPRSGDAGPFRDVRPGRPPCGGEAPPGEADRATPSRDGTPQ
jgi:hypothetical protein